MKNAQLSAKTNQKRRQAMALILVIITVALLSVLIVAIFSVTRTEYKATQSFVSARSAKQYADYAVAITQAQLQNAQNTSATTRTIHATQPGMARVYAANGDFMRAHKLYSSSQMVITGGSETAIFNATHQVPQDWNATQNKARYVDLNEPVVRPGLASGTQAVYFPIIDPRAAYTGTSSGSSQVMTAVEGFSYAKSTPTIGGSTVTYNEVVLPSEAGNDPNKLRLPMPVEWIYVLQDGTTGTLNSSNKFISSDTSGEAPTAANPIVGRVAFWADDESCKINVNTASEPTFFAPPYFYHERDSKWANFPGASGEYQRYPGHPATVALSAVLAPGVALDPLADGLSTNAINNIVETKELIYSLIPKVATGGSRAGTRPFVRDAFSSTNGEQAPAVSGDLTNARNERLFASVDEMLFQNSGFDSNGRMAASVALPGVGNKFLFDHDTLERSRFFLTAHSRSPEFTIYGLPRVAMWPVADEGRGDNYRTTFDSMIALCATLSGSATGGSVANSYIFRRAQPHHATHDVTGSTSDYGSSQGLQRNAKLLNYLYSQMTGLSFLSTSSLGSASNFGTKYGIQGGSDNVAQLAVQFFDYIRCTNLYDGVLARENDGSAGTNLNGAALYDYNKNTLENARRTYTDHRFTRKASGSLNDGTQTALGSTLITNVSGVYPGHGQVTPARWEKNGTSYQGFGRMFTLSEIGFQIICTADGKNDEIYAVDCGGTKSGGGCAPKALATRNPTRGGAAVVADYLPPNQPLPKLGFRRWYSNFPPLKAPVVGLYGTNPLVPARHPINHPGFDPANWNTTLLPDTPLTPTQKRVQVMLMLEMFCPMLGWTKMYPEWAIVLNADFVRSITLVDANGQKIPLFPTVTSDNLVIKSNGNVYESNDVYSLGGHSGPTAIAGGRSALVLGQAAAASGSTDTDPYLDATVNSTGLSRSTTPNRFILNATQPRDGLNNWGLVSQYITVNRGAPMQLEFGQRDLQLQIFDKHERIGQTGQAVQTINLSFTNMTLPVPALVYGGERRLSNDPTGTNPNSKAPANRGEINHYWDVDNFGRDTYRRSLQAPHWWCFSRMGCLNRWSGTVNPQYNGSNNLYATQPQLRTTYDGIDDQVCLGRLDTEGRFAPKSGNTVLYDNGTRDNASLFPTEATVGYIDERGNPWTGSDVVRTFVPAVGDYRLVAARNVVPRTMWIKHPVWQLAETQNALDQPRRIHSFTTHWATTESGVVLPTTSVLANPKFGGANLVKASHNLVVGAPYSDGRIPDLPPGDAWAGTANSFGDFDNGIANARDGAYVNKPDEGNFYAGNFTRNNTTKFYRSGYFFEPWRNSDDWRSGVYMTPNRMVSSPVMFGSLPTGVWNGGNVPSSALQSPGLSTYTEGKPWQTLLFRPYARSHGSLGKAIVPGHPGDYNPRDHNLLDLFFMPVVEPYAISEPLSVAGRLNLNYQIVPFTHITRATGMHALMKGEFMTTIPLNDDVNKAKRYQSESLSTAQQAALWSSTGDRFYDESSAASIGKKFWHRPIDVIRTLYQFERKFQHTATGTNHSASRVQGLFRSASQICEIHLIPDVSKGASSDGEIISGISNISASTTSTQLQSTMDTFWQNHSGTGDNTRERPYSNLYSRITTRGNTFRVHMRAQVLRKARSVAADTFDPTKEAILGEYRGSTLIERYIDATDSSKPIPDYGASNNPLTLAPLDTFYKFRTLENKRFSP